MSNRKNKRRHYGLYALTWGWGDTWLHCRGLRHERGNQAYNQWRTWLKSGRGASQTFNDVPE